MCELSGDGFACFEHSAPKVHILLDGLWNEIDNILRIFSNMPASYTSYIFFIEKGSFSRFCSVNEIFS